VKALRIRVCMDAAAECMRCTLGPTPRAWGQAGSPGNTDTAAQPLCPAVGGPGQPGQGVHTPGSWQLTFARLPAPSCCHCQVQGLAMAASWFTRSPDQRPPRPRLSLGHCLGHQAQKTESSGAVCSAKGAAVNGEGGCNVGRAEHQMIHQQRRVAGGFLLAGGAPAEERGSQQRRDQTASRGPGRE
jgi:hypothetical protein